MMPRPEGTRWAVVYRPEVSEDLLIPPTRPLAPELSDLSLLPKRPPRGLPCAK